MSALSKVEPQDALPSFPLNAGCQSNAQMAADTSAWVTRQFKFVSKTHCNGDFSRKIQRRLYQIFVDSCTVSSVDPLSSEKDYYGHKAGSLKMNTALEYSTRVVQEGGRRCKKSTLNDLVHLTFLRIPLMNPPIER